VFFNADGEEDNSGESFINETKEAIDEVAKACLTDEPLAKPTSLVLKKWIRNMGFAKQNIAELLLESLQKQSVILEELVIQRSNALLEEMRKLDELLLEMLPRYLFILQKEFQALIVPILT
jgi:hypothetical protein